MSNAGPSSSFQRRSVGAPNQPDLGMVTKWPANPPELTNATLAADMFWWGRAHNQVAMVFLRPKLVKERTPASLNLNPPAGQNSLRGQP